MSDVNWNLEGRTVVVTGASSGMGAETARFLGARGANVVLQGRDRERLGKVAADVVDAGGKSHVVELDLETPGDAGHLADETVASFGDIHGLVLNASLLDALPLADTTLESVQRQWYINVVSHFMIVQAAVPAMPKGSGIVFLSSTTAHVGFGGYTGYAMTKGAIEALSRTLAIELATAGIRVNTVAPGFVRTPMLTPQLEAAPTLEQALVDKTPSGRIGRPEEVGATVAFLLSGLAEYINGTVITIDGGWTTQ